MTKPPITINGLLALDAATCLAMGALLVAGSTQIAGLTDIAAPVLFWAGVLLLPIAAFMALGSRLKPVPAWISAAVIISNVGWTIASLLLPLAGFITPNLTGLAFVIGQAGVVAILAVLEIGASMPAGFTARREA